MADEGNKSEDLKKLLRFQPLRFVHIFLSVILTLYGACILMVALTVKSHLSDYLPFLHYYLDKPVLLFILGSIILIGLGCAGIITTAQNMYQGIVTFGVLLFGLFMFQFTMGVVFLVMTNSADLSIMEALELHVNNYTENSEPMDFIQTNLNCCGINDFTVWNSTLGYIPGSCCASDVACGFADVLSLNETGCYEALKSLIGYLTYYFILVLGVLALLQVTAMIISFFLARGIADYRRRISQLNTNRANRLTTEPETGPEIHNPLGLRGNRVPGERRASDTSQNHNSSYTNRGKVFDQRAAQPTAVVRDSFRRNPIYKDAAFNHNRKNSIQKIVNSVPTQLPRAHRKYPIGF